jgi:hypothetical protein
MTVRVVDDGLRVSVSGWGGRWTGYLPPPLSKDHLSFLACRPAQRLIGAGVMSLTIIGSCTPPTKRFIPIVANQRTLLTRRLSRDTVI